MERERERDTEREREITDPEISNGNDIAFYTSFLKFHIATVTDVIFSRHL